MAVLRAPVLRGSVLERCMNQSAMWSVNTCEPDESGNRTTQGGLLAWKDDKETCRTQKLPYRSCKSW